MAITFTIAGVDRTNMVCSGSLSIQDELNSRNTCSFEMIDESATYEPWLGANVVIKQDGVTVFAGTIDALEKYTPPGTQVLSYRITCIDYNQLCDRHLVANSYVNKTLKQIVVDIVNTALAGEGITTNHVQDGPVIEKAVFNYQTVAEAFDELSRLTGYKWNIDYNKDLWFFDRTTYEAPFGLTATSGNFRSLSIRRTREQYRNKQYVRGARAETDPRTEAFVGDGKRKTFTLAYPVSEVHEVSVNGAVKVVAVQGTPGADWYYTRGGKELVQADDGIPLSSTDILTVYYTGFFPIVAIVSRDQEIKERKTIEGGTGVYEDLEYDENLETQSQAQKKAEALIALYGKLPRIIEFETDTPGLAAGQMISINLPNYNLNDKFLIYNVSISDQAGKFLRYRVQCVGSEAPNWIDFFRGLTRNVGRYVIRENEVVVIMRYLLSRARTEEVFRADAGIAIGDVGRAMVGFSEVVSSPIWAFVSPCQVVAV